MKKKTILTLLMFVCALFAAVTVNFVLSSGVIGKYPDAEYLTAEEAAVRPVYSQLSAREKAIYTSLYRGVKEEKETIPLPFETKGSEYSKIYRIFEKQEGEFFFLDSVYYTAKKVREAKIAYKNEFDTGFRRNELNNAVKKALKGGSDIRGDYYIATYLSNYIINNCKYVIGDDDGYASTAYGCLVEGKANCEGYSKAFNLLASGMGLESQLITGTTDTGENHAWNQVKIGVEWYNLDVTWEDTDVAGEVRKEYFLRPDKVFARSHIADGELFEPQKCSNDNWNAYKSSGHHADTLEQATKIVKDALSSGNNTIDIEFSDLDTYDKFKYIMSSEDRLFPIIQESGAEFNGAVVVKFRENEAELCMTVIIDSEE